MKVYILLPICIEYVYTQISTRSEDNDCSRWIIQNVCLNISGIETTIHKTYFTRQNHKPNTFLYQIDVTLHIHHHFSVSTNYTNTHTHTHGWFGHHWMCDATTTNGHSCCRVECTTCEYVASRFNVLVHAIQRDHDDDDDAMASTITPKNTRMLVVKARWPTCLPRSCVALRLSDARKSTHGFVHKFAQVRDRSVADKLRLFECVNFVFVCLCRFVCSTHELRMFTGRNNRATDTHTCIKYVIL